MKFASKYLLSLLTLFSMSTAALQAQPVRAERPSTQKSSEADAFYNSVRSDLEGGLGLLGQDYYVTYRLVERIARANGLDEQPWRIRVSTEQNVNAFASQLNMLSFEGGLFEQLAGDHAAVACVVGHEIAHHTKNHIPAMVEMNARVNMLKEEALVQARDEVESAGRNRGILGGVADIFGGGIANVLGGGRSTAGVLAGVLVHETLDGLSEDQTEKAVARAEELYLEEAEALDAEFSEQLHEHELEADQYGYEYMVRAGFDPNGCSRVMNVLTRIETSRLPSFTHPNAEDRLDRVASFNTAANNQRLTQEGKAFLSRSAKPLGINIARDGGSLRVESRFGSQDIDAGFPQ